MTATSSAARAAGPTPRAANRWPHRRMLVLALVVGCGGPPRADVSGTVTLDGRPLGSGRIIFEQEGRSYTGLIGADGRYDLRGGASGVAPGTYAVAILPPAPEFVPQPNSTDMRLVNPPDPRTHPERYRSTATSGITRAVAAGRSIIDIELSSQ